LRYLGIFGIKLIGRVLGSIPASVILKMGTGLGVVLDFFEFRKRVVVENLRRAFPEWSDQKLAAVVRAQYTSFGCLLLEFLRSFHPNFGEIIDRESTCEGLENLDAARAGGKGALVMTAHIGNWEAFCSHGAYVSKIPVTMVTKRLEPAWFQDYVVKVRESFGTKMAFEPKTMQLVIKTLRDKKVVGFAIDQFAGSPVGARVPFFGVPVGTHTALAVLAQRFEAPVVPGYAVRKPGGGFHVVFEPALPFVKFDSATANNPREQEIIANTAAYNQVVERWVRRYPEQWLWIHRRWKGDLSPLAEGSIGEMMKPD
jgi:Kdo2-lipid IVA lauroyltransferase/acyltransferase